MKVQLFASAAIVLLNALPGALSAEVSLMTASSIHVVDFTAVVLYSHMPHPCSHSNRSSVTYNSAQPQLRGVIHANDFEDELVLLEEPYEVTMEYVPSENEFTENNGVRNAHYGIRNAHARVHQKILNAHDRVQKKIGSANQRIAHVQNKAAGRLARKQARVQKKIGGATQRIDRAQKRAAAAGRLAGQNARAALRNQKTVPHTSPKVVTHQIDEKCLNCPTNNCSFLITDGSGKKCCHACDI